MRPITHADSGNATENSVNIYTDVEYHWIRYYGTRPQTNPNGPRSVWYVRNERTKEQHGPFHTLRAAKTYVHGVKQLPEMVTNSLIPEFIQQNGTQRPEIEGQLQLDLVEIETESESKTDLLEFACPHCGKAIVGIVGKG